MLTCRDANLTVRETLTHRAGRESSKHFTRDTPWATARNIFRPMTAKSTNKLVTYIVAFYYLQACAGLIGGIAYALYATPVDLAPWVHLLGRLLCNEQRSSAAARHERQGEALGETTRGRRVAEEIALRQ